MVKKMNIELEKEIIKTARIVKNFPKKDVNFIDISPILENINLYNRIIDEFCKVILEFKSNKILGIESRGFLFASPSALNTNIPLVLARKGGKVPFNPVNQEYGLEYGKDSLEISAASINSNDSIAIVDDVLATGGTAEAAIKIINKIGGKVSCIVTLGDLPNLNYRDILSKYNIPIVSLAKFVL
jgi:adenine phosphoribosyltransferase